MPLQPTRTPSKLSNMHNAERKVIVSVFKIRCVERVNDHVIFNNYLVYS